VLTPQFLRFLMVGLLNTAFGYGFFATLTWLGLSYPVAIALATLAGIAFNFQTTGRLVFDGAPLSKMGRFAAVYGVIYAVNVGGVALLLALGLNVYLANALLILPLALLAYVLQQKFVFAAP
jgi:putative flippase GtrA